MNLILTIRQDDLQRRAVQDLLRAHLENMHAVTPAGSVRALNLERLRGPEITFWSAWVGEDLAGCGALKALDLLTGEIKSMRTVDAWRGRGVASSLLEHIVNEARGRGYRHVLLETGALSAFAPARRLYERFGFVYRCAFADYPNDPNSVFMTLRL